jgi:hypothetical protein
MRRLPNCLPEGSGKMEAAQARNFCHALYAEIAFQVRFDVVQYTHEYAWGPPRDQRFITVDIDANPDVGLWSLQGITPLRTLVHSWTDRPDQSRFVEDDGNPSKPYCSNPCRLTGAD